MSPDQMSEKMTNLTPVMILMPSTEEPADQPPEPKPKLNPKDWNQKYVPGEDKWSHAIAAVCIAFGSFFLGETVLEGIGLSKKGAVALAFVFTITAALGALYGKEVWDSMGHGNPDIWDFLCGVVAFVCVALPIIVFFAYTRLKDAEKGGKE